MAKDQVQISNRKRVVPRLNFCLSTSRKMSSTIPAHRFFRICNLLLAGRAVSQPSVFSFLFCFRWSQTHTHTELCGENRNPSERTWVSRFPWHQKKGKKNRVISWLAVSHSGFLFYRVWHPPTRSRIYNVRNVLLFLDFSCSNFFLIFTRWKRKREKNEW